MRRLRSGAADVGYAPDSGANAPPVKDHAQTGFRTAIEYDELYLKASRFESLAAADPDEAMVPSDAELGRRPIA